ncbi:histone deacetylase and transcriptional regulator [Polyrhizophydium stewartii]|uniref:Histone deacetylase and transcriptional regulator n=1 Tax=Polyrhizophydium stewartii TaxID=2732419 RepID=A0ABR4N5X5_9FUNG
MSAHYQPYQYGQPPAAPDSHMDGAPGGQIPPTPHRTHASPAAAQRPATATHQAPPRTPGSGHSAAHHPMPLGHSASAPHSAGHPHAHAGTGSGLYANGHGQSHGPAQAASLHHSPAPVHASASAGGYPMPHQSHHPQSHAQQHHHVPRPRPAVPTHPASAASAHSDARAAAAMAAYDVDEDDNDDHYEDEDDEEAAREAARRERRQAELMERVEQLNRTFWERRGMWALAAHDRASPRCHKMLKPHIHSIFQQKLESYRRELKEIRLGQHPDYLEALAQLERERDAAILKAELFREYELQCAQEIYDKEHEAALAEYMAEKEGLREKMLGDLEERKRKLKEDRDSFDVSSGVCPSMPCFAELEQLDGSI